MSVKATTDFRKRRKANLIKVSGNCCNICGYNKIPDALEFHHINPELKEYGISSSGTCHDLEKDLAEINKCILVCANCHREIHFGLYSLDFLKEKKIYLEEIANILRQEKFEKTGTKEYFCKKCNTPITKYASNGLCSKCVKIKQEYPEREELKNLIRNLPFTQIGQLFGVSDNAIKKWCKKYDLPHLKSKINLISDEQW